MVMGALTVLVTVALISVAWSKELSPPVGRSKRLLKPSRMESLDLEPSNPLGMPRTPGTRMGPSRIPISSGMFAGIVPRISNLDFGFIYSVGDAISTGSLCADYLLPISKCDTSMLFTEAHLEYAGYWKSYTTGAPALFDTANRLDVSIGAGYRKRLTWDALVGVNAFFDSSRIFRNWYSSWGCGLEAVCVIADCSAVNFHLNVYGMQFNRRMFTNVFRNRGTSFDFQTGYSRPILNKKLDLRLKLTGYQFDTGNKNYGCKLGTEIVSRNGLIRFTYDFGYDAINEGYHQFGGFVNVSFNLENLLCGKGVICLPPPVFTNQRNLTRIATRKVERNWHQPAAVILANNAVRSAAEGLAAPELMLIASRSTAPGAVSLLATGSTVLYRRFLGSPVWSGPSVQGESLDRMKRVELAVNIIDADVNAPDFTVGVRFVNPHTGVTSDRMAAVPIPGTLPAGTTVVRVLDERSLTNLENLDAQGFVRVRSGPYAGPFSYRVTVNFYR
jgi:hypothetical protein